MSLLTPDFEAKSQAKLQQLLGENCVAIMTSQKPSLEDVFCDGSSEVPVIANPAVSFLVKECQVLETTEGMNPSCDYVVNDKVVKLTELGGRRTVLKESPASLDLVASEEDISKFSLEALKKLVKASLLEFPKQVNKPTLIALLVDAYRIRQNRGEECEEEATSCRLR